LLLTLGLAGGSASPNERSEVEDDATSRTRKRGPSAVTAADVGTPAERSGGGVERLKATRDRARITPCFLERVKKNLNVRSDCAKCLDFFEVAA